MTEETDQARAVLAPLVAAHLAGKVADGAIDDDIGPELLGRMACVDVVQRRHDNARIAQLRAEAVLKRFQLLMEAPDMKPAGENLLSERGLGHVQVVGSDQQAGAEIFLLKHLRIDDPASAAGWQLAE